MATSIAELRRQKNKQFEKINNELAKVGGQTKTKDNRLWNCQTDKLGNGYAVIRFLPAPPGEDTPYVHVFSHGFQGPGGWYIENSRMTLGSDERDPVFELNRDLWNSGVKANEEVARSQKRKTSYYSNIYVVKDPANPENEGKVFLFRYGKKIFEKIKLLMNPPKEFGDEAPVNPFDLDDGANFKLKIRMVEKYPNYDLSEFTAPAPLFDNDEDLETVWKATYPLQPFLAPENFKPYDQLKKRLNKVLGVDRQAETHTYVNEETAAPAQRSKPAPTTQETNFESDEDDDLDFFNKLADDDIPF